MYRLLFNFLQGNILLQIESPYPERVINLCGVHGITFWDLRWIDETTFTLRTTRQNARRLKKATASVACTVTTAKSLLASGICCDLPQPVSRAAVIIHKAIFFMCGWVYVRFCLFSVV